MSGHTKGPWKWRSRWGDPRCELIGADGRVIYLVDGADGEMEDDCLVEAAPDLLDCLTMGAELNTPDMLEWIADRLVSVHGESPFVDFVVSLRNRANAMRKAIAKAKGEPHA